MELGLDYAAVIDQIRNPPETSPTLSFSDYVDADPVENLRRLKKALQEQSPEGPPAG